MDLTMRAYPIADPLRDSGQRLLLNRLGRELQDGLAYRREVPFPDPHDLRAWDGLIEPADRSWCVRVEAETRISDGQALARKLARKMRDGGPGHLVLLVPDTRHNRAALRVIRDELRPLLPLDGRAILAALREGRDPGGSGIVVL